MGEVANTLNTNGNATGRNAPTILVNDYKESNVITVEKNNTTDSHEVAYSSYAVRRLTPEECERLQGFPDEWTKHGHEGKKISDSARYKALGNSVAIPCVIRVLRGITESYNEHQD